MGLVMGAAADCPCERASLTAMVTAHQPGDARERASRATMLQELGRLEHPCDRDADPVHVTASGVVAGSRGTVLHLHRRLARWLQPGGHVEAGEHPAAAALRESGEETGLALAHPRGAPVLVHVDVHPAALGHRHLDLRYLLVASDGEFDPAPGESRDVRWFGWDAACEVADPALLGALRRTRAAIAELDLVVEEASGGAGVP